MREVSREEFQKRMKSDSSVRQFEDMQRMGLVVFDQKELSLFVASKECSLRKLISRLKKNELTCEEAKDHYVEFGKMQSYFDGRICESKSIRIELEKAFAEYERLFWDLQKALGFSSEEEHLLRKILQEFEWFLVAWIENDIFLPKSNHCYPSQDLDIVLDFFFNLKNVFDETFSVKRLKLFSGFQGTFFAKEASPRKPECDNTSCEFELNGECTHPNPQIKPRDCLSWEKKIEPSSRTK